MACVTGRQKCSAKSKLKDSSTAVSSETSETLNSRNHGSRLMKTEKMLDTSGIQPCQDKVNDTQNPSLDFGCHLLDDDLLTAVFNRLDDAGLICRCARVSHHWHKITAINDLWRNAFLKKWGKPSSYALCDAIDFDSKNRTVFLAGSCTTARTEAYDYRATFIRAATTRVLAWGHGSRGGGGGAAAAAAMRVPAPVQSLDGLGVRQVAAGNEFACAVTWDGRLFCWGRNDFGQCGAGPVTPSARIAEPVELAPAPPASPAAEAPSALSSPGRPRDRFRGP